MKLAADSLILNTILSAVQFCVHESPGIPGKQSGLSTGNSTSVTLQVQLAVAINANVVSHAYVSTSTS